MTRQQKKLMIAVVSPAVWGLLGYGLYSDDSVFIGAGIGLLLITFAVLATLRIRESNAEDAERRRVWTKGHAATATVVDITDTGSRFNDHPWIDVDLQVTLPDQPAYTASCRALISEIAIPRVQPGRQIAIKVDPNDKAHVVVDAKLTPYGYK